MQKRAEKKSRKGEFERAFYVALEDAPKILFKSAFKIARKGLSKTFDAIIDSLLESATVGAQDAQEATATFERKQNFVNILHLQLLLIMFSISTKQFVSRRSVG